MSSIRSLIPVKRPFGSNYIKRNNMNVIYMCSPEQRHEAISLINSNIRDLKKIFPLAGANAKDWWKLNNNHTKGHHPDDTIPREIYSLGSGTIEELEKLYIYRYGHIHHTEYERGQLTFGQRKFVDYVREMIKQGIAYYK